MGHPCGYSRPERERCAQALADVDLACWGAEGLAGGAQGIRAQREIFLAFSLQYLQACVCLVLCRT